MEKLNSRKLPVTTLPLIQEKDILFSTEEVNKTVRLSLRPQKSLGRMKSMRPIIIIPTVTDKK